MKKFTILILIVAFAVVAITSVPRLKCPHKNIQEFETYNKCVDCGIVF